MIDDGAHSAHDGQQSQVDEDHRIHETFNLATLAGRASRVENDLRVTTSHSDTTNNPIRVAHDRSTEESRVEGNRAPQRMTVFAKATVVQDNSGVEVEHIDAGRLSLDDELAVLLDVG